MRVGCMQFDCSVAGESPATTQVTQVRIAKTLGMTQDSVSRLEKRSDLLLSTLRKKVEAMGGNLTLVAQFPDRGPVVLAGMAQNRAGVKRAGG